MSILGDYMKLAAGEEPAEPEKPSLLRRAAPYVGGALAAAGTYAAARKFRGSANPALRALQEKAKNTRFEIATDRPDGRGQRTALFGARDIPSRPDKGTDPAAFQGNRAGATVLNHSGASKSKATGDVNINNGQLPGLLDDKWMFHQLQTQGTGGGAGMEGAVPRTHLLDELVRKHKGNFDKVKGEFPSNFVIKPRSGSMSKAENLITNATTMDDPRLRRAIQNPKEHIIQEMIPIESEHRVHMLNNEPFTATHRQIPHAGLRKVWDKYMGGGGGAFVPVMGEERQKLMDFARQSQAHIGKTPDGSQIQGQSENMHHALDIAKLRDGSYKLIESNPTPGTLMNPMVARGLQRAATGRMPVDVSAGMAGAAGLGTAYGASKVLNHFDKKPNPGDEEVQS